MNEETKRESVNDAVLRELINRPSTPSRTLSREQWEQRQRRAAELEPILREFLRPAG